MYGDVFENKLLVDNHDNGWIFNGVFMLLLPRIDRLSQWIHRQPYWTHSDDWGRCNLGMWCLKYNAYKWCKGDRAQYLRSMTNHVLAHRFLRRDIDINCPYCSCTPSCTLEFSLNWRKRDEKDIVMNSKMKYWTHWSSTRAKSMHVRSNLTCFLDFVISKALSTLMDFLESASMVDGPLENGRGVIWEW